MVGNSVPEEALRLPPPACPASPPLPALSFPFPLLSARVSLPGPSSLTELTN